jgi:hypothetical protein
MILAQHGYGPSDRVETGMQDGSIHGVILSAANINPDQIASYCTGLTSVKSDALLLFDPEYYVNFIQEADKFGKLADYPYFNHPMAPSDLASPKRLLQTTEQVLRFQIDAGLKKLVAPTLEITSFGSAHEPYALSLLNAAVEYVADNQPDTELYGSLVINESAFYDLERMALFLDAITRIKGVTGFYIVIDRTDSAKSIWTNPQNLAAYMYLVHTLSANKKIILGYTDGTGLLGLAVGAGYIGNGWWLNSGNFTKQRFVASGGRRRATYYSKQLMSSIYVDGELSVLVSKGFGEQIAGSSKYDAAVTADPLNPTSWSERNTVFHKWLMLSDDDKELAALSNEQERLELLSTKIAQAKDLSEQMNGLLPDGFKSTHGPEKLRTWLAAIEQYRKWVL